MQMTQIPQRRPILFAHAPREPWIIQPLIPRRLGHILQHAQPLLYRLTPIGRHLPPCRQHIILDVLSLVWSHPCPDLFFRILIRSLLRIHVIPLAELLPNLVLLFGRHPLESLAALEEPVSLRRRQLSHRLHPRSRRANSQLLPRRKIPAPCAIRSRLRSWICPVRGRRLHRGAVLMDRRPVRVPPRRVLVLLLKWLLLTELRALLSSLLPRRWRWRSRVAFLRGARQQHNPA